MSCRTLAGDLALIQPSKFLNPSLAAATVTFCRETGQSVSSTLRGFGQRQSSSGVRLPHNSSVQVTVRFEVLSHECGRHLLSAPVVAYCSGFGNRHNSGPFRKKSEKCPWSKTTTVSSQSFKVIRGRGRQMAFFQVAALCIVVVVVTVTLQCVLDSS
jgi:hypothetical protein